jgi:hypothetical protein
MGVLVGMVYSFAVECLRRHMARNASGRHGVSVELQVMPDGTQAKSGIR